MEDTANTPTLSWEDKLDQLLFTGQWVGKLGKRRLKRDCSVAENLALRVAVLALVKDSERLKSELLGRLNHK